ncbi:MAG: hypothetical protein RI952_622 [Bacteroidota bacterium]
MFKRYFLYSLVLMCFYANAEAQSIKTTFFLETDMDHNYLPDTIHISKCSVYLSNFKFYQNEKLVFTDPEKAYLINLIDPIPLNFEIPAQVKYNRVAFDIGVDSLTNVAGVLTNALDPRNGMYWSWQSGYVNFKIEGDIKSIYNKSFQYHIGGYSAKLNALQSKSFEVSAGNKYIFKFSIIPLLTNCHKQNLFELMSPQLKAVQLAKVFADNISCRKISDLTNE